MNKAVFGTLFANLRTQSPQEPEITRRQYSRRACDQCVCVIDGSMYPVKNWSMGGVAIEADPRNFNIGDTITTQLKFKTATGIIDISQKAKIVRKTRQSVSMQFDPITAKTRTKFQAVIDDYVSNRFKTV